MDPYLISTSQDIEDKSDSLKVNVSSNFSSSTVSPTIPKSMSDLSTLNLENKYSCILSQITNSIDQAVSASEKTKSARLLAVSKTKSSDQIKEIYDKGQRYFGENYVNELIDKSKELPQDINWHMIGHLQSNKVKKVLEVKNLSMIESVDSIKLANELDTQCKKLSRKVNILVQVCVSNDNKSGIELSETMSLVEHVINNCDSLIFNGLMSIGTIGSEDEFKLMFDLKQQIVQKYPLFEKDFILSMGTSDDYELAIKHGANQVRVGSKLFGKREYLNK